MFKWFWTIFSLGAPEKKLPWTILEEQFPVPKTIAVSDGVR